MDGRIFTVIFSSFVLFVQVGSIADDQPPKLILISLDGLRYDFITPERTPNLYLLSREGVFLQRGVKVQVHTVTAPNHYTICTGLHEESHGIIDNAFWDPLLNETYDIWNFRGNQTQYERSKMAYWYEGTTPIWQTNEESQYSNGYTRQNQRRSGSFHWPMGDCYINNKTIFKNATWPDYGNLTIWQNEIDQLINWLMDKNEPVNFALYYNAQPDHVQHGNDVYGPAVEKVIADIDSTMGYLINRLQAVSLWDEINLILTADHGHTDVLDNDHIIRMGDYLDFSKVYLNGRSIFPIPGTNVTVEEIYKNLTLGKIGGRYPIQIWYKQDFPSEFHYTNNRRIGPVIVYEQLNYELVGDSGARKTPYSTHGWLNEYAEMRAFFIAYGPAFKSEFWVSGRDDIENVDIYPLMCKILEIDPVPNNGSLDRIKFILRGEPDGTTEEPSLFTVGWFKIRITKRHEHMSRVFTFVFTLGIVASFLILVAWTYQRKRVDPGTEPDLKNGFGYRRLGPMA